MSLDRKRFLHLLKRYRSLTPKETKEMIDLQRRFPYAQSIRAMATWGAYHNDLPNKKKQLQIASVFTADLDTLKAVVLAPRLDKDVDDHGPQQVVERTAEAPSPSVRADPPDTEAPASDPSLIRQRERTSQIDKAREAEIDKESKTEIDKVLEDLPGGLFNLKRSRVEFEEQLRELALSSKEERQQRGLGAANAAVEAPLPIERLPYPVDASEDPAAELRQTALPPPTSEAKKNAPKKTRKTAKKTPAKKRKTAKKTLAKKRKTAKKKAVKKFRTPVKAKKTKAKTRKVAKKRVVKKKAVKKTAKKRVLKKKASTQRTLKSAKKKPAKTAKRTPIAYRSLRQQEQFKIIDKFISAKPTIKSDHTPTRPLAKNTVDFSASSGVPQQSELSETLVDLLLQQGKKEKAIELLKKLIWKHPKKKSYFEAQINALNGFR